MAEHHISYNLDEQYVFESKTRNSAFIAIGVGILLIILGIILATVGGHEVHGAHGGEHAAGGHEEHHGMALWAKRLFTNLWINNVYFTGIALCGVFFVAVQYAAWAGWSSILLRIPQSFGFFLPIGGVLMIIYFLVAKHELFHWTHPGLTQEGGPEFDEVIASKTWFLTEGFFLLRMVVYIVGWFSLFWIIRKQTLQQDVDKDLRHHDKSIVWSVIFIIFFAVTSSMSAWDWSMSVDPHWFSTMYGWYTFASWWVASLATITLTVISLKKKGYLPMVTENHLHDLGKFMFAFSIFWTYVWFAQFMLIYYANIPEEIEHFNYIFESHYKPLFFVNILVNFVFPFLALMTRDAKRKMRFLQIVACGILAGHWLDFFLNMTPYIMGEEGGIGFMELGVIAVYAGVFVLVIGTMLSKVPLIPKNHPMLEESLHHNI